jgi:hypothetical protein
VAQILVQAQAFRGRRVHAGHEDLHLRLGQDRGRGSKAALHRHRAQPAVGPSSPRPAYNLVRTSKLLAEPA